MPLSFATLTVGVPAILTSAFPFADAKPALGQILPTAADAEVVAKAKTSCKLPRGTFIFGYDIEALETVSRKRKVLGRVCRDVIKGGWHFASEP